MTLDTLSWSQFLTNSDATGFPSYYLPYGVFIDALGRHAIGVGIGTYVFNLTEAENCGLLKTTIGNAQFQEKTLNKFASNKLSFCQTVRDEILSLFLPNSPIEKLKETGWDTLFVKQSDVKMTLPFYVRSYSDFYASLYHAANVGRLFRGNDNPLLPNWHYLPVAYHGRATTVFPSGTAVKRPAGQIKKNIAEGPIFSTTHKLDYEVELGIIIGDGNLDGTPIPIHHAYSHIFGLVILNDWSARDIQSFEYQPLGPFLSKSFATSISTWVVPNDIIRDSFLPIEKQNPIPVGYLYEYDRFLPNIKLNVSISTSDPSTDTLISTSHATDLYWTFAQMISHHTVSGCILESGDLLGTGTISGDSRDKVGCLMERTLNGAEPIRLINGEERGFLEDGDIVTMEGIITTPKGDCSMGKVVGQIIHN